MIIRFHHYLCFMDEEAESWIAEVRGGKGQKWNLSLGLWPHTCCFWTLSHMPLQIYRQNSLPPWKAVPRCCCAKGWLCLGQLCGPPGGVLSAPVLLTPVASWLEPLGGGLFFPYLVNATRLGTTAEGQGSTSYQNSGLHFILTLSVSRKSKEKSIQIVLSAWPHKKKVLWWLPVCHSKGNHAERRTCLRNTYHLRPHRQHRVLFPGRKWNHSGQGKSWASTYQFGNCHHRLSALHLAHVCPRWGQRHCSDGPMGAFQLNCAGPRIHPGALGDRAHIPAA